MSDVIEKRKFPRLTCDEKVQFDVPSRDGNRGFVKTLSVAGCLLLTIEKLPVDADVLIHFILAIGDETMEMEVAGRIVNIDRSVEAPFKGYGIAFSSTNPPQVARALHEIVQARLGLTPAPTVPVPAPKEETKTPAAPPPERILSTLKEDPRAEFASRATEVVREKGGRGLGPYLIFFGFVLLAGLGKLAFGYLSSAGWKKELTQIVPFEKSKLIDYDLYVVVTSTWLEGNSSSQKEKSFIEFGKSMEKFNIHGAHFADSQMRVLADVLICDGDNSVAPRVTWKNPPQAGPF